jgi:hypothetical protein
MGGWHLRKTWCQEVCYASLHSEPASALSLLTVWSLWGNPGMARCQRDIGHRRAAVGHWVSLGVWSVVGWLIVYQDGYYLYPVANTVRPSVDITDGWYCLRDGYILMAGPSTFLESRSWWVHDCGKQTNIQTFFSLTHKKLNVCKLDHRGASLIQ